NTTGHPQRRRTRPPRRTLLQRRPDHAFHPPERSSSVAGRTQCGRPLFPVAGVTVTAPKCQTSSINNW
ncbi:hypothetical protein S245_065814, partial [Arachis hypogaea]